MLSWWNADCSNHYTSCVQHINRTATVIPHKTLINDEDIFNIIIHKSCKKENLSSNNTTCLVKSQETLWIKPWSNQKTLIPEGHKKLCRYGQEGWVESIENSLIPCYLQFWLHCNFYLCCSSIYAAYSKAEQKYSILIMNVKSISY